MTQYAAFDATQPAPQPVTGWYDTAAVRYPTMPVASNLLAMTPAQWAARTSGAWAVSGGTLVPYTRPAPPMTLGQTATAALSAGLTITSTSTPNLSGTYAVDAAAQSHIQAQVVAVMLAGTFADGTATLIWPDMTGTVHTFQSVAEFKAFASAVTAYQVALFAVINGTTQTLPAATATIA